MANDRRSRGEPAGGGAHDGHGDEDWLSENLFADDQPGASVNEDADPVADAENTDDPERGGTDNGDGPEHAGVEPGGTDRLFEHVEGAPDGRTPVDDAPRRKKKQKQPGSFWRELPMLILIAFVLAFLLRTFVLQVFFIPSSSMEPTLQVDDRMIVEKVTYYFRDPERGEIVVFEGETMGEADTDANLVQRAARGVGQFVGLVPASAMDYVKRVIGIPGDEVELRQGTVYVNGQALEEPYARLDQSDFGPETVPEDHLFFLGDNRGNSSDSRRSLGFVPSDHVVGRSVLLLWPFDNFGGLTGVEYDDIPEPDEAARHAEEDDVHAFLDVPLDPAA